MTTLENIYFRKSFKFFSLESNKILELPDCFFELPFILNLEFKNYTISNNLIEKLHNVRNLRSLEFKDCSFNEIFDEFYSISKLEVIKFINCPIRIIKPGTSALSNLHTFVIDNSLITSLPDDIGFLPNLSILSLPNNHNLTTLPNSLNNSPLKHLNISYSSITTIPNINMPMVEELFLTGINLGNNFVTILLSFPSIKKVRLDSNNISEIPEEFFNFVHLEVLNLNNNKLTFLPSFSTLTNLKNLDLNNNKLRSISSLPENLTMLVISNNKLRSISSLPENLRVIDFSNNQLRSIESLPASLQSINLSHNGIEEFPEAICSCPKLAELYLSHNKLKAISPCIFDFEKLSTLDLEYNQFIFFPFYCIKKGSNLHLILMNNKIRGINQLTIPEWIKGSVIIEAKTIFEIY